MQKCIYRSAYIDSKSKIGEWDEDMVDLRCHGLDRPVPIPTHSEWRISHLISNEKKEKREEKRKERFKRR